MGHQAGSEQRAPAGSAFALGWAMAQLYGPLPGDRTDPVGHLPAVAELAPEERLDVAFAEVHALARPFGDVHSRLEAARRAWHPADRQPYLRELEALHTALLERLVAAPAELAAYQLGRALSDTCWLPEHSPGDGTVFLAQFDRRHLATLGSWLDEAAGTLPPQAAAVAGRSLQNWQDWADVNSKALTKDWSGACGPVVAALRTQGPVWRALLAGAPGATITPSINAWTRAGESTLRTARTVGRRILFHFWPLAVVIMAATAGLLYLAISDAQGTMKVWTSLVTAAGAVGLSGASFKSAAERVAEGVEQEVWHAATLDARAWEVTWLPTLPQGLVRGYRLYRRGVARPRRRAGLEPAGPQTRPG